MYETAKTLKQLTASEREILNGRGIDIGCGADPVTKNCVPFDMEQGDANHILDYITGEFDYVWSSHCLEHMREPEQCIQDWWKLVKPGGYMFIIVPDEDLYEQGVFPSRFNSDHKWTFTICKQKSWSPASKNMLDLIKTLSGVEDYSIRLQDEHYDRRMIHWGASCYFFQIPWRLYLKLKNKLHLELPFLERFASKFTSIDQTLHKDRMAQIFAVIRKRNVKSADA